MLVIVLTQSDLMNALAWPTPVINRIRVMFEQKLCFHNHDKLQFSSMPYGQNTHRHKVP
jgi:hypothetical protein